MEPRKRPHSAADLKPEWFDHYPDEMYAAFNNLIQQHWDGEQAVFYQIDVIDALLGSGYSLETILAKEWHLGLAYMAIGWDVDINTDNDRALPRFIFKLPAIMSRPQP